MFVCMLALVYVCWYACFGMFVCMVALVYVCWYACFGMFVCMLALVYVCWCLLLHALSLLIDRVPTLSFQREHLICNS